MLLAQDIADDVYTFHAVAKVPRPFPPNSSQEAGTQQANTFLHAKRSDSAEVFQHDCRSAYISSITSETVRSDRQYGNRRFENWKFGCVGCEAGAMKTDAPG